MKKAIFSIFFILLFSTYIYSENIDTFEGNSYPLHDDPYNPTNIQANQLFGYWYCVDDSGEDFSGSSAIHSHSLLLAITNDTPTNDLKSLFTSFTLGVSDSSKDKWAYWEIDTTLSSNDIEKNLTGKTLAFWIKGNKSYSIDLTLVPSDTKASSKYGYDLYHHTVNVTTSWQQIVVAIDSNNFTREGTDIPFSSAVTEVVAISWSMGGPESGSAEYYELFLDDIAFTNIKVTQSGGTSSSNNSISFGVIDDFEEDAYPLHDDPYDPTNIQANSLGGSWYCVDDHDSDFSASTTAHHSYSLALNITNDTPDNGLKSLFTSFTLGVSDSANDVWGYWELDCPLSSDGNVARDLTGQILTFWMKGNEEYDIDLTLVPKDTSKYGDGGFYKSTITVSTEWKYIVLSINDTNFEQPSWIDPTNAVPFSTAVKEVVAFSWSMSAPDGGAPHYYELFLDNIKFSNIVVPVTNIASPMVSKGKIAVFGNLMNFRENPSAKAVIEYNPSVNIDYVSPALTTLQIFDLNGNLIFEKNISLGVNGFLHYEWDGKDGWGNKVNTGIYVVKVTIGETTKLSKILIIR